MEQGEHGDHGRRYVLDLPMLARIQGRGFQHALDVGCSEGQFCRMMQQLSIATVGIDATVALLDQARTSDPAGDYRLAQPETMDVVPGHYDLVVSYLSLIGIPYMSTAMTWMVATLCPGGTLLIANLNSLNTAGAWVTGSDGKRQFCLDQYLDERAQWSAWRGIRIRNWHRPLPAYTSTLLEHGLLLRFCAEPTPIGGDPAAADRYTRVPSLQQ